MIKWHVGEGWKAGLLSPSTYILRRGLEWDRREKEGKKEKWWMPVNGKENGERGERLQRYLKRKRKQRGEGARSSPATRLFEGKLIARKATFQITLHRENPLLSPINEDGTLCLQRKPCRKKESAMNSRRKHRWRNTLIRHQNHARTKHCSPKYSAKAFCQFHRKK